MEARDIGGPTRAASSNRLFDAIAGIGVRDAQSAPEQRRIHLTNLSAVIGTVSTLGFVVTFLLRYPRTHGVFIGLGSFTTVFFASALLWNRLGRPLLARLALLATANLHIAISVWIVGRALGWQYYFFVFPPVTFLLLPSRKERFLRWGLTLFSLTMLLALEHHWIGDGWRAVPAADVYGFHVASIVLASATLVIVIVLFHLDALHAERALVAEHERSEKLLRNILPNPIADRLKQSNGSIADGFADASVLFADLVGFTELSSRLAPAELVRLLNRIFSELDDLCAKRGIEKIKTIGDAYMVASGLPDARPDHVHALARMAVDMLTTLDRINDETGHDLALRIGIHTGPVVAGVIGKRKFIYDLWGDTVNIASRMESHGVAGAIQVTRAVRDRIADEFEMSDPREIQVKGKGQMEAYLIVRRKILTQQTLVGV